jgi:hypothetical protein
VDPNGAAFIIYRAITLDPKVEAFFKEVPQAAGILRSLARPMRLHMPDWLKLPKRPRKPKPKAEKPPKPPKEEWVYPFPGVPRRWQTQIPGINAPRLKNKTRQE